MKCPVCKGKGTDVAWFSMNDKTHYIDCHTCNGTGLITYERMCHIIAGKAAREARKARGETIMQAARRKGVTALEISKFERGE